MIEKTPTPHHRKNAALPEEVVVHAETWFFNPGSSDSRGRRPRWDWGHSLEALRVESHTLRPGQVRRLATVLQRHLQELERSALDVLVDQTLLLG